MQIQLYIISLIAKKLKLVMYFDQYKELQHLGFIIAFSIPFRLFFFLNFLSNGDRQEGVEETGERIYQSCHPTFSFNLLPNIGCVKTFNSFKWKSYIFKMSKTYDAIFLYAFFHHLTIYIYNFRDKTLKSFFETSKEASPNSQFRQK